MLCPVNIRKHMQSEFMIKHKFQETSKPFSCHTRTCTVSVLLDKIALKVVWLVIILASSQFLL